MIIETTDNRFYSVRETGDAALQHVWFGHEVKKCSARLRTISGCDFAPKKANPRTELVRKAGSRIVREGTEP